MLGLTDGGEDGPRVRLRLQETWDQASLELADQRRGALEPEVRGELPTQEALVV
jgi:hypothetical protein